MTWMGSTRMEIAFQSEGWHRTSHSTVQRRTQLMVSCGDPAEVSSHGKSLAWQVPFSGMERASALDD
jgi:hypothetical protein